jgi:beta-glucanase (GH16 family)
MSGTKQVDGWKLVWNDEFEGDRVDPAKWDFDIGNGFFDYKHHAWISGWGNEELQYYTREPDNVFVKDSLLTIRAVKESLHGCGYTSARLKTRKRDGTPLFTKLYGRFEFRAKVPWGKGMWPALWMLPQEDRYGGWAASGEIDVMEIVGEKPDEVLGTIHFGSTYPKRSLVTHVYKLPGDSLVSDWHVYTVEWEPGEIRWLVDGVHWATQNFWWSCSKNKDGVGLEANKQNDLNPWPAPFDQPFYLVMNVAVGGNFPGHPNPETQFPAELVIDYVRVYDRVGGYGEAPPRGPGQLPFPGKRQKKIIKKTLKKDAAKTPKKTATKPKNKTKPKTTRSGGNHDK